MAMKKGPRLHDHQEKIRDVSVPELEAQLAPPEESGEISGQDFSGRGGAIVVDTGSLKLPATMLEEEQERRGFLGLDPAVLVIVLLFLLFIIFIAYLVSRMPPPKAEAFIKVASIRDKI